MTLHNGPVIKLCLKNGKNVAWILKGTTNSSCIL